MTFNKITPTSKGFGLMGFTWRGDETPDEVAFPTMKRAVEKGILVWNSAEFYGTNDPLGNLKLIRRYFEKYPEDADKVCLMVKGGLGPNLVPNGSKEFVQKSMDTVLETLGGSVAVSIFQCARVDPNTPIEETANAIKEYVDAGKIGALGLSEVGAETIEKVQSLIPVAAVEVEVSLWATDIFTNGVAEVCAKHNIPIAAYAPLGSGVLTGRFKGTQDIPEGDARKHMVKYQDENIKQNLILVDRLKEVATKADIPLPQMAIAWVRAQSNHNGNGTIVPIPGNTTVARLEENNSGLTLSAETLKEIDEVLKSTKVVGERGFTQGGEFMNG
ncbi:Pyridoxal reductase [Yarrowia sp. C11]|nr:Pyridoxal reductase [Yarrowia sp. C11]KAG5364995.1 Pyridoxal reductase [Yarrowia sp. E02]